MPAIRRPNAPLRLPSEDFRDLFHRPLTISGLDAKLAVSTPSPLSTPPNWLRQPRTFRSSDQGVPGPSSPLASTSLFSSSHSTHVDRRIQDSDISNRPGHGRQDRVTSPEPVFESLEEEEVYPPRRRALSTDSSKVQEILGLAQSNPSQPSQAIDGAGFRTHEFLGGRIQIRLRRKSDGALPKTNTEVAKSKAELQSAEGSSPNRVQKPVTQIYSVPVQTTKNQQKLTDDNPEYVNNRPPTPKEGLYFRTRRALGLKRDSIDANNLESDRSRTPTARVFDRVASTLRQVSFRKDSTASTFTSASKLSVAASRGHRWSLRKQNSTSSSIRESLVNKPPISTTEPAMYTGSDSKSYITEELSETNSHNFLPSEARRINTPPLPSDNQFKSKSRGFFFDYNAPTEEEAARILDVRNESVSRSGSGSGMEWYTAKMDEIDKETFLSRQEFAASVPDHLANSPLCPRHPSNKSKEKGSCPMHGRNDTTPSLDELDEGAEELTLPLKGQKWW